MRQKYDFFRNMWGVPEDIARMMESNNNMQAMDIIGQYKDRALQVPSAQFTAAILNGQASYLSDTIAPIFPTSEFNFESQFREMNQIEFTRTAVGGIPNEQTYRTTSWKDTIEKVQLNARLEMDLALDPNFGEDQWLFQLAGLASNAELTIHKTIAYALIHIAYTNMVGEHIKQNLYDLSRALAKEEEAFAIAAFDQTRFLRMIRRVRDQILDFDTVIVPHGAIAYLSELKGESTSMLAQRVQMDPVTQELQWQICKGKKSVVTVNYGEETMHFLEMPQFRVNMQRDSSKEQVMRTSVTVAQAYQCDPDVRIDVLDTGAMKQENLDIYIFNQTKNQGEEAKISITDAYAAAFYWDDENPRGDGLNDYVHSYCRYLNSQIQQDTIPWKYNHANNKRADKSDDINKWDGFDYDTPNMDYLLNKEKLLDMRGWRDEFFGLIYLPDKREYRVPKRIMDFTLDALPNRAIHKVAKAIAHAAGVITSHGVDFDAMMKELFNLLSDIDNSPWTDEWIVALVNANIEKMYNFNEVDNNGMPTFNPAVKSRSAYQHDGTARPSLFTNATPLKEWRGDRFGSLELPRKNGRITQVYPPGFGSGPGLQRLAQEADDDTSEWREVGARAKRVVVFLEMLDSVIREYIGPTDVNNECLTPPWFHVDSPITVLIDSIRHYKAPVFLGVPAAANINVDGTVTRENADRLKKFFSDAMSVDVNIFVTGGGGTPSTIISSVTKFVAILDSYNRFISDNSYGAKISGLTGHALVLLHKLVDYTVRAVYNPSSTENEKSIKMITYLTNELIAAKSDVKALATVGKNIDFVLAANKSKKDAENITNLSTAADTNVPAGDVNNANITIKRMKDREEALRANPGITLSTGRYSYDQMAQALNDFNRLNNTPNRTDDEEERLDRAKVVLGDMINETTGQLKNNRDPRVAITLDLSDPRPLTFLRAPLVSGDRLIEYMQRSRNPLIRPSDPGVFHEAPLDIITEETMSHSVFHAHKKGVRVPCSALPYSQLFRQGLSGVVSLGSNFNNDFSGTDFSRKSRTTKSTYSSSRTRDISDFVGGFDRPYQEDMDQDYQQFARQPKPAMMRKQKRGESAEDYRAYESDFKKYLDEEEYFGPKEARYDYITNNVSSLFEKIIFKAIMLAPNRITIHKKIAAIGQKLVNVLIFRLFIQHVMSSTIVMKAGRDTLKTAIGHGKVWVNTEQRGFSTINAGFYLGIVRVNPNAIQMLPFTFPEAFVGGMGVTFMRDKSHFRYSTTDKESMIAMLTPITETKYEYPLHILNLPTYNSRDISNAPYNRKWSSSGYFAHVFGYNALCEVHGQIEEAKKHYGHAFDISLCVHRGPVRYTEAHGRTRMVQGTGPRGHIRMNIPGAEATWNGTRLNFPDYAIELQKRQ